MVCRKIEGLETLVNLQVLNLEDNMIERVPLWLVKKLRCLRTVRLANNNITSVSCKVVAFVYISFEISVVPFTPSYSFVA